MWDADTQDDNPNASPKALTRTGVKARGWTDKMIRELLGAADERRPNHRYPTRPDFQLYWLDRVEEAERTDAFFELLDQSEARKNRGLKAAEKSKPQRLARTQGQVEGLAIVLPDLPAQELIRRACASYNAWAVEKGVERVPATPQSPVWFLDLVSVKFLRHSVPGYHALFDQLWKQPGAAEGRRRLDERIYQTIALAHPALAEECERQNKRKLFPTPKQQALRERQRIARQTRAK